MKQISATIDTKVEDAIKKIAQQEKRSFSFIVNRMLTEAVEKSTKKK